MRLKQLLILALIAIISWSCSPKLSHVILIPETETVDRNNRGVVQMISNGVVFECDFIQSTQYDLLFELNLFNDTEDTIYLVPEKFNYLAIDKENRVIGKSYAFNADNLIFEIEQTIEADRQAAKDEKTLGWVIFGVEALAAIVGFANEDYDAAVYAVDAGITLAASQSVASQIEKHVVRLEGEKEYYENAALRDSKIKPAGLLRGLVIFPRFDVADHLDFEFEINGEKFNIIYRQDRFTTR